MINSRDSSAMREKLADRKIVLVQQPMVSRVDREVVAIPGIIKPGVYQFSFTGDSRILNYRAVPCWCANCVKSEYDACLSGVTGTKWKQLNLTQVASVVAPVPVVVPVVAAPVVAADVLVAPVVVADVPVAAVVPVVVAGVRSSSRPGKGQNKQRE